MGSDGLIDTVFKFNIFYHYASFIQIELKLVDNLLR